MGNAVLGRESRESEMMMAELEGIRDACGLGILVHNALASIILQRDPNIPSGMAPKVPRMAVARLAVRDDTAAEWANGG